MVICVLFAMAVVPAYAASSGTCGDNLTWTLSDSGTLTISGSGDMTNFSSGDGSPWHSSCASIKAVVIQNGVTSIGNYAFYGCESLTNVYYIGTAEDWNKITFGKFDGVQNVPRHYNSSPSIEVTANGTSVTVTPTGINAGNSIIIAVYKDGKIADIQHKIYDGANCVFSVTVPYDTVKAMMWENLTSMKPLCPAKTIPQ